MTDFVPNGYCKLFEVFERVGRAKFGDKWTGGERTANILVALCSARDAKAAEEGAAFKRAEDAWDELRQRLWAGKLTAYTVDGADPKPVWRGTFAFDCVRFAAPRGAQLLFREKDVAQLVEGLAGPAQPASHPVAPAAARVWYAIPPQELTWPRKFQAARGA